MPKIHIKPNTDKVSGKPYKVRLPDKLNEFLPAKGMAVEKTKYWLRRLRDRTVIDPAAEAERLKAEKIAAATAKAEKAKAKKAAAKTTTTKE